MYAQHDKKHKVIDFFDNDNYWIEGMSYEDTALLVNEITKLLGEAKENAAINP